MAELSHRPAPHSAEIDLVHLARQTAGDRSLEREVLVLFRDQSARLLAAMSMAGKGDRAARDAAHTLLGAARGVGAFRIAGLAEQMEKAASADLSVIAAELEQAVADARALIDRLLANH